MTQSNVLVAVNPSGSTVGVRRIVPTQQLRPEKCEVSLSIGVFFDGTGNARDGGGNSAAQWQHEARRKHSNVCRLFRTYPDDSLEGFFPVYVAGLGTPFPDIGENEPASMGNAFAQGGDGRVNYGLLHVFNAVHRAISPSRLPAFTADVVKALCRNGVRGKSYDEDGNVRYESLEDGDEAALSRVGMDKVGGLLMTVGGDRSVAQKFYIDQSNRLANLIANVVEKPKLKEIFIDVFGFSRGATEARTFCNWLDVIFSAERLFGVVAHIRFLGIFDTVASVGTNSSSFGNGHMTWGAASYLGIPPRVRNCEHYVAMHENRPSFPVEYVERQGVNPSNCRQFAYPGMHSDVGGGYFPDEQGRWISESNFEGFGAKAPYRTADGNRRPFETKQISSFESGDARDLLWFNIPPSEKKPEVNDLDSRKLSQIPLNHMYLAARAANVPLDARLAMTRGYNPLTIHPLTQRAFNEYMAVAGGAKPQREWLLQYLSWRYQVRNEYGDFNTTTRSSAKDRDDLQGANQTLLLDIDAVENDGAWQRTKDALKGPLIRLFGSRTDRAAMLAPEAPDVLSRIKSASPVPGPMATMFKYLCHDSYAGFRPFDQVKVMGMDIIPGSWEAEGYLRYRRRYEGDDKKLTRLETPSSDKSAVLA